LGQTFPFRIREFFGNRNSTMVFPLGSASGC
jgi:hypothetical protein